MSLYSPLFYDNELIVSASDQAYSLQNIPELITQEKPLIFHGLQVRQALTIFFIIDCRLWLTECEKIENGGTVMVYTASGLVFCDKEFLCYVSTHILFHSADGRLGYWPHQTICQLAEWSFFPAFLLNWVCIHCYKTFLHSISPKRFLHLFDFTKLILIWNVANMNWAACWSWYGLILKVLLQHFIDPLSSTSRFELGNLCNHFLLIIL